MGIFDWFKRKDGKSIEGKNKNADDTYSSDIEGMGNNFLVVRSC